MAHHQCCQMMSPQRLKNTILQNNRVLAYCVLVTFCSLLSLPEDYKVDKRNILNEWFVKIGWFWTNALIIPLLFLTIRVDDRETVSLAIFRIVSSTVLWYTSINLFQYIDTNTGFDISGHTFLLMFSNLIITSEIKLSEQLNSKSNEKSKSNSSEILKFREQKAQSLFVIRIVLLVLTALWDFMLLQTALYYHTILQKAIAGIWAIGSWYILHTFFYHKSSREAGALGRGDL